MNYTHNTPEKLLPFSHVRGIARREREREKERIRNKKRGYGIKEEDME